MMDEKYEVFPPSLSLPPGLPLSSLPVSSPPPKLEYVSTLLSPPCHTNCSGMCGVSIPLMIFVPHSHPLAGVTAGPFFFGPLYLLVHLCHIAIWYNAFLRQKLISTHACVPPLLNHSSVIICLTCTPRSSMHACMHAYIYVDPLCIRGERFLSSATWGYFN